MNKKTTFIIINDFMIKQKRKIIAEIEEKVYEYDSWFKDITITIHLLEYLEKRNVLNNPDKEVLDGLLRIGKKIFEERQIKLIEIDKEKKKLKEYLEYPSNY